MIDNRHHHHDCNHGGGPHVNRVPPRLEGELNQTIMYLGVAYIPRVVDGYLQWSNEYDLPNPAPVYIQGQDGVGISSVVIGPDDHFIVTLSDNSTVDCGEINFPKIVNEASMDLFPKVGSDRNIYISDDGICRWDDDLKKYVRVVDSNIKEKTQADWTVDDPESPAYIKNKPDISSSPLNDLIEVKAALRTKVAISNEVVPGALMIADNTGNIACSGVSSEELFSNVKNLGDDVRELQSTIDYRVMTDIGALSNGLEAVKNNIVKSEETIRAELATAEGAILNRVNSDSDLINNKLKNEVDRIDGVLQTLGTKTSELDTGLAALDTSLTELGSKKIDVLTDVIPGSLIISKENGQLEQSELTYEALTANLQVLNDELQAARQELAKKVELVDEAPKSGALVIVDDSGVLKSLDVTHEMLTSTLEKKVEITSEIIEGSLMIADGHGNLKCSGVTYDELLDIIDHSGVQADWAETDPTSKAFIKNKPNLSDFTGGGGGLTEAEKLEIQRALEKKVEISNDVVPGALMVADFNGNIACSGYQYTELVRAKDLITGSVTKSIEVQFDGNNTVSIPAEVKPYPSLNVYHNGKMMIEGVHYSVAEEGYITLLGFTTYKGDYFTFMGHGSTSDLTNASSQHDHINKSTLDKITENDISIWNTVATHNHDSVYVKPTDLFDASGLLKPELLPEGLGSGDSSTNGGLILGETSDTAFRGDLGSIAYEHALEDHAPASAQENIIEGVLIAGVSLPVVNKMVELPIATKDRLGLVRSSNDKNKVTIEEDGTMSISNIDFSIIQTSSDTEIILNAGNSNSRG